VTTRRLLERNNELHEQVSEELARNREEHRLARLAFDRAAKAFNNDRAVMRALVADIDAHRDEQRQQSEAVTGALVDLAAEIRSWREE